MFYNLCERLLNMNNKLDGKVSLKGVRAIKILQYKVIKIILKLPLRTQSTELYQGIRFIKITDIRNYQQLIYLYKVINHLT